MLASFYFRTVVTSLVLFTTMQVVAATVERTIEATSKEKNPAVAKRQMLDEAQTKSIDELVRETLGTERYQKNRAAIQSKILKMSSRLIPSTKAGELVPTEDGFKMSVLVRVNVDDLDQLLVNQGLYFESDVPPVLLPLIVWSEKGTSDSYAWWTGAKPANGFPQWNSDLEKTLRQTFLQQGFFVLKPQELHFSDAASESSTQLGTPEIQRLTQQRQAQVALVGDFSVTQENPRVVEAHIQVLHVPRSRVLAQSGRKLTLDKGSKIGISSPKWRDFLESLSRDLANQTIEAWRKGATQSTAYRVVIAGSLSPSQIEAFRDALQSKVREVRVLRERLVTSQSVQFEMDSPLNPKDLAQRLADIDANGAKIVLKEASDEELRFQVSSRSRD